MIYPWKCGHPGCDVTEAGHEAIVIRSCGMCGEHCRCFDDLLPPVS